jgi:2-phosphosulfolactate phosphatase
VIDVLRATTMIAALLDAGAHAVRTTTDIDRARAARAHDPAVLLGGERDGLPCEGFDMGNSPARIDPLVVRGREIVLTTTNGTGAIAQVSNSGVCLLLSLTNLDAVAARLRQLDRDALLVCSGTDSNPSDEDELAAGLLVDRLRGWRMTDAAEDARDRALGSIGVAGGIGPAVARSVHARRLTELGFADDVSFCAQCSVTDTVPTLDQMLGGFVRG